MPIRTIRNSYNAGELSEYMAGRTDINKYHNGCSKLINATVLPHGGVVKRSGTEYIAKAPNKCRLIPFEFSVDDALALEFSNQLIRFYKSGDRVYETAINLTSTGEDDPASILAATAHGYSDGDWVTIESVNTATSLNDKTYIIQNTGDASASLLSHWKMDDSAASTTVLDAQALHNGATGGTNTSAMKGDQGGAGASTGTALDIGGAGANAITVGDHADYEFGDGAGTDTAFSISAWAYIDNSGTNQMIIAKGDGAGAGEWGLYIDPDAGGADAVFVLSNDSNGSFISCRSNALTDASWTHIVATYDASKANTGMNIYINGSLDVQSRGSSGDYSGDGGMEPTTDPVKIGSFSTVASYYNAELDDIRIYTKELTGAESAELYNGGSGTSGTIGTRSFTLTDTEGNDVDATAYGEGSGGTVKRVYEITSPYTSEEVFEVHTTQSADVMYIAHEDHHPQKLSRTSDTSWTIEDVPFEGGPFLDENLTDTYLMGFARTGGTARSGYYFPAGATGTLTASGGHTPFQGDATDVGTLWQIKHTRPDNSDSLSGTGTWTATATQTSREISIKGDFNIDATGFGSNMTVTVQRKSGNGDWQDWREFTAAVAFSSTEEEDDVSYRVTVAGTQQASTQVSIVAREQVNIGIVQVTSASSTTVANVTVIDPVLSDNSTDNAVTTSMWSEGSWGEFRGFPRTVTFFEDRLWWASSTNNPDTLWGSKSGLYEDMEYSVLGLDDDAITATLQDNEVSQIQWMVPRQVLAVGAANKEYRFGASDPDKPVTPSDRKSTPQTSFGSDSIQPLILNNAIFFFQRQGRKLRAMKFDAITENFQSDDATLLANTILESSPTCMAVQRVPDSIIWIVRTDGVLLSFTFEPDEEVSGWARHITQNSADSETAVGFFESVAVIHGDVEDEVWVSVRRIINGNTVRYVERFATRFFDEVDEAMMLDSAVRVESAFTAQSVILASDTVRYNNGKYNSSLYGGTT